MPFRRLAANPDVVELVDGDRALGPPAPPCDPSHAPARVLRLPAVYSPSADSRLLAAALAREPLAGRRVLDLCTGTGIAALAAARAGAAQVVATDVSRRAVLSSRLNLWRHRCGEVRRGDLFAAAPSGHYDVIVSNPPYVPAATDDLPQRGPARAWDGGRDGRAILDRICREAPGRLCADGLLLLVHSDVARPQRTLELLRDAGLDAEIALRRDVPFGPVMTRRSRALIDARLIDDGQQTEQLVVIRATAPRGR